MEKALIVNDLHCPNHDEALVNLILFDLGKRLKPDIIFLNGDIIDNWSLSRYPKHPSVHLTFSKELDETKNLLRKIRACHKQARIVFIFGNHCYRFDSYLAAGAPELYDQINLEKLLGLEELGIEVVRSIHKENWTVWHGLHIGHYDCVSSQAGSTAQKLLQTKGVSLLQGHIHRVGQSARTLLDRTIYAYENGCLAKMNVDYVKDPNWQQGAAIAYGHGDETWVYLIAIKNRKFIWEGRCYEALS